MNRFLFNFVQNPDKEAKVGLNVFLLILSLVEFFATVWASSLCCGVLCCGASEGAGQVIFKFKCPSHFDVLPAKTCVKFVSD